MSFKLPDYLNSYLNSTKYRKPFENFVSNGTFYSQLNYQWMDYMQTVVRPCIAYSTASVDGNINSLLSSAAGMAITKGVTRLIVGDKVFFNGDDEACKFLSDIWSPQTNFNRLLTRAVNFMLTGGTAVLKINRDERGRNVLSASRIDRAMVSTDESGEVTSVVFFISLLSKMQNDVETVYWLTEERKYNEYGEKVIIYKVFSKSGTEKAPVLPDSSLRGIRFERLPARIQSELRKLGINATNEEIPLPVRDGLGVWLLSRTATNSCIPDAPLGDPLLFGALDLLWSIDVVFSGSLMDVLNGEGKILVPKQFLQDTLNRLQSQYPNTEFKVTTTELKDYHDDRFVYIMPSMFDKDKMLPTPVQFDIRAEQYGKMWELYERAACVRAGFSPTSIFPYLVPDNSAKTATEVTAEENLTRASVREIHGLITPVINRALREVLYQEGFSDEVQVQLSDYIGNKLQFDQNVRENLNSGLIPQEIAVKQVNNLTEAETQEYMAKIRIEEKQKNPYDGISEEYQGILNDNSEQTVKSPSISAGRSGSGNSGNNAQGIFEENSQA